MKPIKEITACEYCDKQIDLTSPPLEEYYEQGQISIKGTILLSKAIVKKNHKKGITDSHATSLNGRYCDYKCLYNQIMNILKIDLKK